MEIKVKRANKILRIDDSSKKTYLDLGYDVIDGKGKIIGNDRRISGARCGEQVFESGAGKAEG